MSLKLKIIEGENKGQEFAISVGQTIGRTQGDVRIADGKMSSLHAKVIQEGEALVLIDLQSTNGVRVNGVKQAKVALSSGVIVQLGRTFFEVFIDSPVAAADLTTVAKKPVAATSLTVAPVALTPAAKSNDASAPLPPASPATSSVKAPLIRKKEAVAESEPQEREELPMPEVEWDEFLADMLVAMNGTIPDEPSSVAPLDPPLVLKFTKGLQLETTWTMGYGPRVVGSQSLEFPLFEEQIPAETFRIIAKNGKPLLQTAHPGLVRINGEAKQQAELQPGDWIEVGTALIEVLFLTNQDPI